jgi:hypothetical protein
VNLARDRGGIVAGERHPQRVGPRRGGACGEHALDRFALRREAALRLPPALAKASRGCAQRALLRLQRSEATVRLRDGALRVAQRVARLAPRAFLLLELLRDGVDPRAQLRQLRVPRLRLRAADQEEQ